MMQFYWIILFQIEKHQQRDMISDNNASLQSLNWNRRVLERTVSGIRDWEAGSWGETGSADRSGVTARQAGVHPETQGEWETDTEWFAAVTLQLFTAALLQCC